MKSSTKILFSIFLLLSQISIGQEEAIPHIQNYDQNDPETVFFSIGTYSAFGLGNNSFSKAYEIGGPGVEIDFNWLAYKGFTIGAKIDAFYADAENPVLIGAIRGTRVTNYSLHAGYYKAFTRELNLHATFGLGEVVYTSKSMDDKFRENGWNIYLQTEANYRFNQTFGVFAKLQLRNDFLDIQAPPGKEDFFNNQLFLVPGIGIRLNLHNPNG